MPDKTTLLSSSYITILFAILFSISSLSAKSKGDILRESEPFSIDAEKLLQIESPDKPVGLDVEVLLDKSEHTINKDGTVSTKYHMIFRILTQAGVENWSHSSASYSPWYENVPSIRARVITAEGVEQYLDTNTIVRQSVSSLTNTYTDRIRLSAPLPGARVGVIVEEVVELSEHRPYFEAGRTFSLQFYAYTYTWMSECCINYNSSLDIKHRIFSGDVKETITKNKDMRHVSYLMENIKPYTQFPDITLPEISILPRVTFTTGKSWKDVASKYSAEVDKQIAEMDFVALSDSLVNKNDNYRTKVEKLLRFVHDKVRYTAYELGEKSLIPTSPAVVLTKKYGDCKDKATLLTGLLRSQGIKANVALLQTGPGLDVDTEMPGLGQFNHAIVFAVEGKDTLWIDATDRYAKVGIIPAFDENRLILIADSTSTTLIKTPVQPSDMNGSTEIVDIKFIEGKDGKLTETSTARGTVELDFRSSFDMPVEKNKKELEKYATDRYNGKITSVEHADMKDLTKPMELKITVDESEFFHSYQDGFRATLYANNVFNYFPDGLYGSTKSERDTMPEDNRYRKAKEYPVYIDILHHNKLIYKMKSPKGFEWKNIPDSVVFERNGISLKRYAESITPDSLHLIFDVAVDSQVISEADIDSVKMMIRRFKDQAPAIVDYVFIADDMIAQGKLREGLDLHRKYIKDDRSVHSLVRYGDALLKLGFGQEARKAGKEAVSLDKESAEAFASLGYYYLHDNIGRYNMSGSDIVKARECYKKAIELDPDEVGYMKQYATLLIMDDDGRTFTKNANLEEAVTVLNKMRDSLNENSFDIELMRCYMWLGQYDKALKLAPELETSNDQTILWIASKFMNDGIDAAINKARELIPSDYVGYLAKAASTLTVMQKYGKAKELMEAPMFQQTAMATPQYFEMLDKASRCDECIDEQPPVEKMLSVFLTDLLAQRLSVTEFDNQLQKAADGSYYAKDDLHDFAVVLSEAFKKNIQVDLLTDVMACNLRYKLDEVGNAVRVKIYMGKKKDEYTIFYLHKERGKYRIVACKNPEDLTFASRMAFNALDKGKIEEARAWLSWAYDLVKDYGKTRDVFYFANAVKEFIPENSTEMSKDEIRLAAAILSKDDPDYEEVQKIMKNTTKEQLGTESKQFAFDWVKAAMILTMNPENAVKEYTELHTKAPEDRLIHTRYIRALHKAKQYEKLDEILDTFKEKYPDAPYPIIVKNMVDMSSGKFSEVEKRTLSRLEKRLVTSTEVNNVAWGALFFSDTKDYTTSIKLGEAAVEVNSKSKSSIHTLATLYAFAGEYGKAHKQFVKLVPESDIGEFTSAQWYLYGLIGEGLGLADVAKIAYEKVEKPKYADADDVWYLLHKKDSL